MKPDTDSYNQNGAAHTDDKLKKYFFEWNLLNYGGILKSGNE